MKKVLAVMISMFIFTIWPFGGLWALLLKPIIGGGVAESFLYPIYGGLILLAGIIAGAAVVICDEMKGLREELNKFHLEETIVNERE